MSSNIVRFDGNDGLELYVDESSGLAYAHLKAIARMLGLEDTRTLRRRLEGVAKGEAKTAEIQTAGGLQGVALYPASVVFKLALEFNPDLAEAMGACGANVYLLGLAGYQVSVAPAIKDDPVEMALALSAAYAEHAKNLQEIALQAKHIELLESDNLRQAEVIDELFDYSSIIRIAKYNGCDEKAFSWHRLKAASKTIDAEIKKVPCPRFGMKNLYSHDAWRLAYPGYKLPETTTLVIKAQ
jgi:hypothetical protein